ncbi:hypothetical protein [Rhodococcus sp. ARC_M6]|uniref:hypothetical protein n=1 Tax=Rhodococcus sp. ARC_M6 TaxID=2928852 RepID=UPI001FB1F95B|nr:hypothetical protein [Rhodococcus sp. ARC_M6]MCJ0905595.1 hypothetical protein [Rhodococcus sp. ARC_M6]
MNPKDRANLGPCTYGEALTQEEFTELDLERQCVLADDASIALRGGTVSYYADKSSGRVAAAEEQCG